MTIEEKIREEIRETLEAYGIFNGPLLDVFTVKISKWYHQGGMDSLSHALDQMSGWKTNFVADLTEKDRIIP